MTEARARAVAHGFTVFSGKGGEKEQEFAFHVVRQLVQPALAAMDEPERRAFLGSWYDIVAAALGLKAPDPARAPDPTGVRDGLDWVMTRLTMMKAPVVLLLDDMHWADVESLNWLASFAPRADDLPLLIVAAYRPDELPNEAAAFRTLVERHRNRPYSLAPLTCTGAWHASSGTSWVKEPRTSSARSAGRPPGEARSRPSSSPSDWASAV
ncbi:AAA family ATPase [Streptomyces sp. GTA36]